METLGFLAAIITTISIFPQVLKVIKSRSTKDLSLYMWVLNIIGVSLWLIYGILKKDKPLILGNFIIVIQVGVILFFKIYNIFKNNEKP